RLVRQIDIAIPDRNRRAGFEETLDNGAADTLRAACDDRIASGEIDFIGHGSLRVTISGGEIPWRVRKMRVCNAALYLQEMCFKNRRSGARGGRPALSRLRSPSTVSFVHGGDLCCFRADHHQTR